MQLIIICAFFCKKSFPLSLPVLRNGTARLLIPSTILRAARLPGSEAAAATPPTSHSQRSEALPAQSRFAALDYSGFGV